MKHRGFIKRFLPQIISQPRNQNKLHLTLAPTSESTLQPMENRGTQVSLRECPVGHQIQAVVEHIRGWEA